MTATTLISEKNEIEYLINCLGSDSLLKKEIENILLASEYSNVHPNEIINALSISIAIKNGDKFIVLVAPLQSGKTGTVKQLCNLILPKIGVMNSNNSALFTCSMTDTLLFDQNLNNLGGDKSNIIVQKMHQFKSFGDIEIDRKNVSLLVRDEDQYGSGKESNFDNTYFKNIKKHHPKLPLVTVSATPYDALDAINKKSIDGTIIKGQRPKNYYGITEMLKDEIIRDLPVGYRHFSNYGNDKNKISDELKKCLFFLKKYDSSIGILRCSKIDEAIELKNQLKSFSEKFNFNVKIMSSKKNLDMTIKEGIVKLKNELRFENKNIVLIIIASLSAGHDLKSLKEKVRFVIETRGSQLANVAQGLPGRLCGYHKNRDLIIYANKNILELYSKFENDPEIFNTQLFQNKLIKEGRLRRVSTQTILFEEHKEGLAIPIKKVETFEIDDLFTKDTENKFN